jgi:hypothetical protein
MNNNLPQVILFQEDEKALNYGFKIPFELNSDVAVRSIEYDLEDFKNGEVKLVGPRPTKDAIYYLHPYKDNEYVHESLGEMYFLEEKLELYKRVGYLLGAKSISTKVILSESKKLEVDVEGKVRVKVVNSGTNVNYSKQSQYKEALEISEKYNQKENYDLNKNIDELRDMTEKLNLHHELGIISLIEARDSRNSGVELSERKVKSEISSEYNRLLQISAQLSSPVFSVGADFKHSLETLNKLNVDIEFVF